MITAEMKTQLEIERLQKQVEVLGKMMSQLREDNRRLKDALKTARELLDQYRTLQ